MAIENRILEYWESSQAFAKLREQNRDGQPWSFLDGPITANNPMGVHHAWGRSYKDAFQRYHAMKGAQLRYQNGFDCQGLWVEVEVEKELGLETKRDIVEYGISNFVNRCKQRVLKYAARQTEQSIRLGYWMEWDDPNTLRELAAHLEGGAESVTVVSPKGEPVSGPPEQIIAGLGSADYGGSYFTFSSENNYTIWSFLARCHEQGFVYRGTDVMPWCARCGTGLSQMEVAEGRKITRHTSVFVRLPLLERDNEALLVWTTTPWTLTSNVAAAVNPEMTYVRVRHGDSVLYLGKGNLDAVRVQNLEAGGHRETHKLMTVRKLLENTGEVEVLGELSGKELIGLRYQGPYDHLDAQQRPGGLSPVAREGVPSGVEAHQVIPWTEVSDSEGTGIVHIAPGCGAEDYRLGQEFNLPSIAPLDAEGHYLEGFGELTGRQVGEVIDDIVKDLKIRGLLLGRESYPHVYPHCWRCKQELVFRQVEEWFIRMDWRDRIEKIVPDIRWIPPEGAARELDWLRNMGDWMISKKRYWGLALPIWTCEPCEHFMVIGSHEQLRERAVAGWEEFEGHTPHRPWIDAVKIACDKCGEPCSRIPDVGNPWLDAGIVPYSTVHYNSDKQYWERWFPADFVVECFPGQFRNWFYALLAMSAMLTGRAPFKVLLGHALVRDARGEEMHKSAGNSIAFDEAAEAFGADVLRYLYMAQNPVQNLNFPDLPSADRAKASGTADGECRKQLLTWWNCYAFFVSYASLDNWTPGSDAPIEASPLDRWITSRLQRLIQSAHQSFGDYALHRFMNAFEAFLDEFSNWYIRRSRQRLWASGLNPDKAAAFSTIHEVLTTLCRLMAPIIPFYTEEMYQNLVRSVDEEAPVSVHLLSYPVADEALIDLELEREFAVVLTTKNRGLALRNQARIKIRQPLSKLILRPASEEERALLQKPELVALICEECNIKGIELIDDEAALGVSLSAKANFKALGPRYGKSMKAIASKIASMDPRALERELVGGMSLTLEQGEQVELEPDDVLFTRQGPEHLAFAHEPDGSFAAVDTRLTPELLAEGIARDFNRQGQDQRRHLDLPFDARVKVRYAASDRIAEAIEAHREDLQGWLLADELTRVEALEDGVEGKVSGERVRLLVEPVGG
ncbi:MAG: class I tRNA ligase family protein [Enhygromyxa sp.]